MPTNILMPALSPTMTEGKLAKWLKNEGDEVKAGDVIAEIETDKATMEVEAVDEGKLQKILVPAGTEAVKVNEPIAVILGEGEDPSAVAAPAPKPPAAPAAQPSPAPAAQAPAAPAAKPAAAPQAAAPAASPAPAAAPQPAAAPARATGERIFASPLARRLAAEGGIDLGGLSGSGPHGRIIKADIEAAQARGPAAKPAAAPAGQPAAAPAAALAPAPALSAAAVAGTTPHHLLPATTMRKVIARRMVESKQQVPHFYLSIDCELDQLLKLRTDLNAKAPEKGEGAYKLSVNDFVIRASALALRKVPAANAAYSEEGAVMFDAVDISVAVAIPGGLITPIVRNADQKGLAAISNDMRSLAGKAREGKLKPEEFQGGTFSISNLGMFGIKDFQAVINPPQGAILAVGAGEQRPVVKAGALAIATVMTCTLSVDHRVLDGAIGAEFLAAFKKLIEDPITMLL
jgi:pyruvate dehydrogenase E2 component (dihydrolipoamide acetyltransferase)